MGYSVQPRDQIFLEGYGSLSFAKNMGKHIGKKISQNLSGKYRQKLLDHAKQYATDALNSYPNNSKKVIQKTVEAVGDSISSKIANRFMKVSRIHRRITQKQLQINMIKKYLKKDISLQKKRKKY